ncbi:hypothetical protein [Sphingomonas prati]|uniref:Phage shock protein B n=1 Tax=Sphingomonas prati TaxID=1843237 RepID=A0A7W9F1L2_9SPHN|nr:hypothetical protein [Sphingomonas prati]MBB5729391.1 hypothetical protein [Sphingomonas prati]GGE77774.1 hypothetical protein GCM10011404_08130 [Sphingomonas prati]
MGGGQMMVVLIVLIACIAGVMKAKYQTRNSGADAAAPQDRIDTQLLADEVRRLRERVAVLERIATDGEGPSKLDREIEALRLKDR